MIPTVTFHKANLFREPQRSQTYMRAAARTARHKLAESRVPTFYRRPKIAGLVRGGSGQFIRREPMMIVRAADFF